MALYQNDVAKSLDCIMASHLYCVDHQAKLKSTYSDETRVEVNCPSNFRKNKSLWSKDNFKKWFLAPFTRYNLLSNRLYRVNGVLNLETSASHVFDVFLLRHAIG